MNWMFPTEKELMLDPLHVEHSVNFSSPRNIYPFGEMHRHDFFLIEEEKHVARVRAAARRYQDDYPYHAFTVRKYRDVWVCRRMM